MDSARLKPQNSGIVKNLMRSSPDRQSKGTILEDVEKVSKQETEAIPEGNKFVSRIGIVGLSFKTAPIAVRESLSRAIRIEKIEELRRKFRLTEFVLLSTCNRIEIYYHQKANEDLSGPLGKLFQTPDLQEPFRLYQYQGHSAVRHLFEVATGLDSLVIGEAQILSQVKESARLSGQTGLSGPILSKLFTKACECGRKAREANPEFAEGFGKSVSLAVVQLISRRYPRKKPNLLLVGSGKMIRLAVAAIDKSTVGTLTVAARKQELEGLESDHIVPLSKIGDAIQEREIDVIITATSSDHFILHPADLSGSHSILVFDISIPRNVHPDVSKLRNVTLLNLDDLRQPIEALRVEPKVLSQVRRSVARQADDFTLWAEERAEIAPHMVSLRLKLESIRSDELRNALSRMPNLSPEEREVIEKMSARLTRRFLHDPSVRMRRLGREDIAKAKEYTMVIQELFGSSEPSSPESELSAEKGPDSKELERT